MIFNLPCIIIIVQVIRQKQDKIDEGVSFMSEFEEVTTGLGEECGVFGAYDMDGGDVASTVYYGLFALQHRGQESCGSQ
mgnify:CR=1 FL=1